MKHRTRLVAVALAALPVAACSSSPPRAAAPAGPGAPSGAASLPAAGPSAAGTVAPAGSDCKGDVTSTFCAQLHVTGAATYDGALTGTVPGSQDPIDLSCGDWAGNGNKGLGVSMLLSNGDTGAGDIRVNVVLSGYHGPGSYPLTSDGVVVAVGDKTFQLVTSDGGKGTLQVGPDGSGSVAVDGWGDSASGRVSGTVTWTCGSAQGG